MLALFVGQGTHAIDRALTAPPADQNLGHHDRNAHDKNTEQIDQHKGAAAIFTRDIGEFPDIAQPYGRTGSRQNKRQAR